MSGRKRDTPSELELVEARHEGATEYYLAKLLSRDEATSTCMIHWVDANRKEVLPAECVKELGKRRRRGAPKQEEPPETSPKQKRKPRIKKKKVVTPEQRASSHEADPSLKQVEKPAVITPDAPEKVKLKSEMFKGVANAAYNTSNIERQKRYALRLRTNLTPDGRPRKVFRRGCDPACITQVLGGSGTEGGPIVKKPPKINGQDNPFIKPGECYVAGRSDWNPWTPFFSGDRGFVNNYFTGRAETMESFHLFLHCAKKKNVPYYHGKSAKGKYMYLGRYRLVPDDDDAVLDVTYGYSSLGTDSQVTMADYYRRHGVRENYDQVFEFDRDGRSMKKKFYVKGKELYELDGKDWNKLGEDKQATLAWVEMLCSIKFQIVVVPVEFVSYDEAVYDRLVENDASNGEVDNSDLGPM